MVKGLRPAARGAIIALVVILAALAFVFRPTLASDLRVTFTADQSKKYWVGDEVTITSKVEVSKWPIQPLLYLQVERVHLDPATGEDQSYESADDLTAYGPSITLVGTHPLRAGDNIFSLAVFPKDGNRAITENNRFTIHAYQAALPIRCPLKEFNALESGTKLIAAPGFDLFDLKTSGKTFDCTMGYPNSDVFVPLSYSKITADEWATATSKGTQVTLGLGETGAFTYVSHFDELFGDVTVTAVNYHGVLIQSWSQSKAELQIAIDAVYVK